MSIQVQNGKRRWERETWITTLISIAGEVPTSTHWTYRPDISQPTQSGIRIGGGVVGGMVRELNWYRMEVEMERGKKKKQN